VASRYDMSVAELKQLNKLRANQVNAGTRLLVAAPSQPAPAGKARNEQADSRQESGVKVATAGRRRPSARRTRPATAAATGGEGREDRQAGAETARKPLKLAQYTIRRGDTLGSIAKQFRVEKDDLLRWNRIQSNDIKPGQTLTIQLVQNTY
jgi:membrane-bound lytic murein transglycosylase D